MPLCDIHAGNGIEKAPRRSKYDGIMRELPFNHSGDGRDRCPYCAYIAGYQKAIEDVKSAIIDFAP